MAALKPEPEPQSAYLRSITSSSADGSDGGGGGSGGPKLSSASYLLPLNLGQYVASFDEHGFEDPVALSSMTIDDLVDDKDLGTLWDRSTPIDPHPVTRTTPNRSSPSNEEGARPETKGSTQP